jgi:hypothetical protein
MPHPNLVPFRLRTSLSTHKRGMSPGTSTVVAFPFTFKVNGIALTLSRKGSSPLKGDGLLDGGKASKSKVGGWWLVVSGWWLVVSGWWLVVSG